MYAIRDIRTGLFLRNFSGPYGSAGWAERRRIYNANKKLYKSIYDEKLNGDVVSKSMWGAQIGEAKLYKSKGGALNSVGTRNYNSTNQSTHFKEWIELVKVTIILEPIK